MPRRVLEGNSVGKIWVMGSFVDHLQPIVNWAALFPTPLIFRGAASESLAAS
jgi:hypothetical protein